MIAFQDTQADPDDNGQEDDDDLDDEELSNWPSEETMKLIEIFRSTPILYDTTHKLYRNKARKNIAYARIARMMDCSGMHIKECKHFNICTRLYICIHVYTVWAIFNVMCM